MNYKLLCTHLVSVCCSISVEESVDMSAACGKPYTLLCITSVRVYGTHNTDVLYKHCHLYLHRKCRTDGSILTPHKVASRGLIAKTRVSQTDPIWQSGFSWTPILCCINFSEQPARKENVKRIMLNHVLLYKLARSMWRTGLLLTASFLYLGVLSDRQTRKVTVHCLYFDFIFVGGENVVSLL